MPNFFINVKERGAKKAKNSVRGLTGAMRGLASSAMAVAGPIVAIGAAYKAISGSIRVGRDFEQSMANLKAVSGATGAEFKALEKMAKDLGGSTKFTASEVAGLGTEFAKLGFSSKEIQKVSGDTLALAAAVGADLPRAAEVAGATLRGFGINAKDTGRVTNLMAASFSGSALDMEKFAESMKVVAPVAKSAGFEIEDTTALLATLANVGIHGSMAGTGLKNVFIKMATEGSALSEALGGPVTSIEEMAPALMKLKEEGIDLSDAIGMVGRISGPAFLALVDGADKMQTLKTEFTGTNAAAEMMAIQLDTLQGRTDILKSATEALGIELFSTSEGGLKKIVEGFTSLITGATNVIKALKQIDFAETAKNIFNDLSMLGAAIVDIFKIYFDFLPDVFKFAFKKIIPIAGAIMNKFLDGIKLVGSIVWEPISIGLQIMSANIENIFITMFNFIKEQFNVLADTWVGGKLGLEPLQMTDLVDTESLTLANTTVGEFFKGMGEDNIQNTEQFAAAVADVWVKYGEQMIAQKDVLAENLGTDANGDIKPLGTMTPEQAEEQLDLFQQLGDFWKTSTAEQKNAITSQAKQFGKNIQTMAKAFPEMEVAGKRAAQVQALVDTYASATAAYKAMAGIPVVGPALGVAAAAAAIGAGLANVKQIEAAQFGMDRVVSSPTMIMAGEAGAEQVSITPLEGPNLEGPQGGQSISVNIQGNVMSEQFVEEELSEKIADAVRRGVSFGLS
tara:strand:+ start:269 stop:2476 length:2208 start_codon:yes stop_codon:yes gene_type:complete